MPATVGFSQIKGQERALHLLRSSLERQRVHHAWIFAGPSGVGKERVARLFAATLLCRQGGGADGPCGACASCEKVERDVHPDVLVVMPEAEAVARKRLAREDLPRTPSRDLKIEQIRGLEAALALSPVEGKRRVVLLLGAESMNHPAQNAFLKTLEEPPEGTHIILIAEAADRLLPTIRSRCIRVPFVPLPLDWVAEQVAERKGLPPDQARLCAALAGGSLGAALEISPSALEGRAELLAAVESLTPDRMIELLRWAETISAKGREDAEAALDLIALFYRDAALLAEGAGDDRLANRDLMQLLEGAASRGTEDALRRHRLAARARDSLRRPLMARLVVEKLLLSYVFPELQEGLR